MKGKVSQESKALDSKHFALSNNSYSIFFYTNNWRSSKIQYSGFYVIRRLKKTAKPKGQLNIYTIRIGGYRSGVSDSSSLLTCKVVSMGEIFPTFQDVDILTMKKKALISFETSGTTCPVLFHTPEDWNLRTCSGWMKPPMISSSWYAQIILRRTQAYTQITIGAMWWFALLLRTEEVLNSDPTVTD